MNDATDPNNLPTTHWPKPLVSRKGAESGKNNSRCLKFALLCTDQTEGAYLEWTIGPCTNSLSGFLTF